MTVCLASISLPSNTDAPKIAREAISACGDLGLERLDDVLLCASELVSNAARHGSPPIHLELDLEPEDSTILLEVADAGVGEPLLRTPPSDATGGRGLLVVDAVSTSWGCERLRQGKTVWARFRIVRGVRVPEALNAGGAVSRGAEHGWGGRNGPTTRARRAPS